MQPLRRLLPVSALTAVVGRSVAETLKVGYLPVTGHAKFFVAKE